MTTHGGWIGVDFDGTLATYYGWDDPRNGQPVPTMVARVRAWRESGIEVRIITARVGPVQDRTTVAQQREYLTQWCQTHLGEVLPITACKDFHMTELWDDRAIQVRPNTGTPVDPMVQAGLRAGRA